MQKKIISFLESIQKHSSLKKKILAFSTLNQGVVSAVNLFLQKKYVSSRIERVLILPLGDTQKKCNEFQLIIGFGDEITREDLLIYWNKKEKRATGYAFKVNKSNLNPESGVFGYEKLDKILGLKAEGEFFITHYLGVEEIKYFLKRRQGYTSEKKIHFVEAEKHSDLLKLKINPSHIKSPIRFLNVIYRLDPTITFITLKDIFLDRWSFKYRTDSISEKKEKLLEYNPYEVVRSFLRNMNILPEIRKGRENRNRYPKEDLEIIVDSYRQYKGKKSIEDIIKEERLPNPTFHQLESIRKILNI